jgi:hypothetical protein
VHHFLWTYPKIDELFNCQKELSRQGFLALGEVDCCVESGKIVMNPNAAADLFATVDGIWERQHLMKIDKGFCSKTFAHAALKYKIAVDIH